MTVRLQRNLSHLGLGVLLTFIVSSIGLSRVAAEDATPTPRTMPVAVYFLRDDKLGTAHREIVIPVDKRVATATIRELLAGPNDREKDAGLTTSIPDNVDVLDLTIDDASKVATIALSASFAPRDAAPGALAIAQIVFTLTQFPNVERVAITVAGESAPLVDGDGLPLTGPAARTDYERVTPLIFIESPVPGDHLTSPVRLWGTANTFEAEFHAEILDADGDVLAADLVVATSGNGTRGTFDVTIPVEITESQSGTVVVYDISARDGGRGHEVMIPVELDVQE